MAFLCESAKKMDGDGGGGSRWRVSQKGHVGIALAHRHCHHCVRMLILFKISATIFGMHCSSGASAAAGAGANVGALSAMRWRTRARHLEQRVLLLPLSKAG